MIKESVPQEGMAVLSGYVLNNRGTKWLGEWGREQYCRETDKSIIIVGDVNTCYISN